MVRCFRNTTTDLQGYTQSNIKMAKFSILAIPPLHISLGVNSFMKNSVTCKRHLKALHAAILSHPNN